MRERRNWEELRIAPLPASPVPTSHRPRLIICPFWPNDGILAAHQEERLLCLRSSANEITVKETRPTHPRGRGNWRVCLSHSGRDNCASLRRQPGPNRTVAAYENAAIAGGLWHTSDNCGLKTEGVANHITTSPRKFTYLLVSFAARRSSFRAAMVRAV